MKNIIKLTAVSLVSLTLLAGCSSGGSASSAASSSSASSSASSSSASSGTEDSPIKVDLSGYDLKETLYDTEGLSTLIYDGKEYELPVQWSELEKAGLVLDDEEAGVLPHNTATVFAYDPSERLIAFGFYNDGDSAKKAGDCVVFEYDGVFDQYELTCGKRIGRNTTKDQVLEMFGMPTSTSDNIAGYVTYYWQNDEYKVAILIDEDYGTAGSIGVTYLKALN